MHARRSWTYHGALAGWQKAFFAALEITGSVTASAKAAGVSTVTAYAHKRADPVFAKQWEEAQERSADELEDEARRRAKAGSDVLLMFLLKGLRPLEVARVHSKHSAR